MEPCTTPAGKIPSAARSTRRESVAAAASSAASGGGENRHKVVGAEGTMNRNTHSKDGPELVRACRDDAASPRTSTPRRGPWLALVGPAEIFERAAGARRRSSAGWGLEKTAARMAGKDLLRVHDSRTAGRARSARTLCQSAPARRHLSSSRMGRHASVSALFGNSRHRYPPCGVKRGAAGIRVVTRSPCRALQQ